MSTRTEYLATLGLLVVGGVLGLVTATRVWGTAMQRGSLSTVPLEVTGNDLVPLASAVSLVSLAAVVAVPAVRGVGRRIVGGVLILLGGGVAIASWMVALSLDERVADWAGSTAGSETFAGIVATEPIWAFGLVVSSLVIWTSGILVAVRGPAWPGMSARYERRPRRADRPSRDAWEALDRGEDPTEPGEVPLDRGEDQQAP